MFLMTQMSARDPSSGVTASSPTGSGIAGAASTGGVRPSNREAGPAPSTPVEEVAVAAAPSGAAASDDGGNDFQPCAAGPEIDPGDHRKPAAK